jgi:tetratricopeptide (TPR) repeat protein/capsular polysaccharide biosynthesis protein
MKLGDSIQLAIAYLRGGSLSQAHAICQTVIKLQPDFAEAYQTLGKVLEAQGEVKEAMSAYVKALELQPELVEARAYLGQLYRQQGGLEEAAFHYRQALARRPDWAELHYNLGIILYQLGDLMRAKSSYQQAISLKSNYVNAYYNLGVVLDESGQQPAAIQVYQEALTLKPDYVKAYSNLGCVLVQLEQFDEAIEIFQKALTLKPDWATLHNNLGQALQSDTPKLAIASYHRAIELQPDLVVAHYNLGKAWQLQGQHAAAVDYFRQVIQLNPHYVSAYSDCGFSLMAQGQLAEAMVCFQESIALQPAFVEAYCHWASLLTERDELTQAKIACSRFLKALQQSNFRFGHTGESPKSSENHEKTNNSKSTIPNLNSENSEVYVHLVQTYVHLGNALVEYGGLEQAEVYYQKALQIQPLNPDIYLRLGKVLEKQQRFEQAITYYRKVLQLQLQGGLVSGTWKLESEESLIPRAIEFAKGVYQTTWDWMVATKLNCHNYFQVSWNVQFDNNFPSGEVIENHSLELASRRQEEQQRSTREIPNLKSKTKNQKSCGGLTCTSCLKRLCGLFKPILLGYGIHFCSSSGVIPIDAPVAFVAVVPDGRAIIAPQKNYWKVCDCVAIITSDNYLLADVSRDYPWYLPGCQLHDFTKHQVFTRQEFPPLEQIDGTVAVLSGLSGNVYYHWMVDILPRIEILRRSGVNLEGIDLFLVNSLSQPFQRESLNVLGIPLHKILESDRHPHIQAKQLFVPSFPGPLDWITLSTIEFLRETFLTSKGLSCTGYPERIYISRNRAKYRRVLNEEELIEKLKKIGFVSIFLESLSLEKQIALFAHAKVIIAAHGSGLTNTIFCRKNTKIIEFFSPNYIRPDYWIISHHLGLEHYYLVGELFACYPIQQLMYQTPLTEDILVNLISITKLLEVVDIEG